MTKSDNCLEIHKYPCPICGGRLIITRAIASGFVATVPFHQRFFSPKKFIAQPFTCEGCGFVANFAPFRPKDTPEGYRRYG